MFAGALYLWWPLAQQSKSLLIEDDHLATTGVDNPCRFQTADDPYCCFSRGASHVSDFLFGEWQIRAYFSMENQKYSGDPLLHPLTSKIRKTALRFPEPSSQ